MQIKKYIVIPLLVVMLASSCSLLPTVTVTQTPTVSPEVEKELYKTKLMLETEVYSKQQLLDKLVIESNLSVPECQYIVDNCGADWKEMAYKTILPSLNRYHYSMQYYYTMLTTNKYTQDEIDYVLNKSNINWNEVAQKYAQDISRNGISEKIVSDYLREEGFSEENIEYATNKIDWYKQAYKAAQNIAQYNTRSRQDLIEQMESLYFTKEQAVYGVDKCGIDWNERAYEAAYQVMHTIFQDDKGESFRIRSKDELIDYLISRQFTQSEVEYAVNKYAELYPNELSN